ncbi:MAG TPA: MerR family transcriptional regulator [Methylibium sp.]|uniref:MerR family transcriptional regulator n=1 Tax=Methylibium sp. TaxID=2067992 RepID=UPI002DBDB8E8|nr:MerR family transcriptional regulator [Methylibium sp.]HEU4460423.1 MerR family transcriptional regulator [Methylibium sp.]
MGDNVGSPGGAPRPLTLSIAAVERDTGLSKDTLRMWERRYGFPAPQREGQAERAYPLDQVEKLRVIKRLLDAGHRPGRIVSRPVEELQRLSESTGIDPGPLALVAPPKPDLQPYLDLVHAHDVDALRRALLQASLSMGLARFVIDLIAPLNTLIGDTWMRGHLEIFEEHLYTESVHVVLRRAIAGVPAAEPASRPCVVLSTFPNEPHSIGLLMAEPLFLLEGCRCVSLGVQTPVWDLTRAVAAQRADIVALSFSSMLAPTVVSEGLAELRDKLPPAVEIWAGGSASVLHRRPVPGVTVLASLEQIALQLRSWRAARR